MTEPEYVYVKGAGWQASYGPFVYRIKENEVRVGDVIVGWSYRGRVAFPNARFIITTVIGNMIINDRSPSFSHYINGTIDWFEVER